MGLLLFLIKNGLLLIVRENWKKLLSFFASCVMLVRSQAAADFPVANVQSMHNPAHDNGRGCRREKLNSLPTIHKNRAYICTLL